MRKDNSEERKRGRALRIMKGIEGQQKSTEKLETTEKSSKHFQALLCLIVGRQGKLKTHSDGKSNSPGDTRAILATSIL
jgi:hypothetical protein